MLLKRKENFPCNLVSPKSILPKNIMNCNEKLATYIEIPEIFVVILQDKYSVTLSIMWRYDKYAYMCRYWYCKQTKTENSTNKSEIIIKIYTVVISFSHQLKNDTW